MHSGSFISNLEYAEKDMGFETDLDYNLKMIAFDAQTSGGLLISVSPEKAEAILADLHSSGLTSAAVIGEVTDLQDKYLYLEN